LRSSQQAEATLDDQNPPRRDDVGPGVSLCWLSSSGKCHGSLEGALDRSHEGTDEAANIVGSFVLVCLIRGPTDQPPPALEL